MNTAEFKIELNKLESGLRAFALKLTKDRTDALDLYQETAYRAFKSIHQFRSNTNLRAWLMTIMRNTFINIRRSKKRRPTIQDGSNNNFLLNNTSHTVANQGELKVNYEQLASIVDNLDEHLRVPFWLAYKGYKYIEIAENLDVPIGTIKSRVFMARKKIQEQIKNIYQISSFNELRAA